MNRRLFLFFSSSALMTLSSQSFAKEQKNIELFGLTLKGASRDLLRKVLKKNGLQVTREDRNYWVDTYKADGVLDGASELVVGYVAASDKFAYATYTFPGFIDTQLIVRIINMVATKYGRPSTQNGNYNLGEVTAKWNVGQGMKIVVSRGWPDTTTYLSFIDPGAKNQMQAEISAEKKRQLTQQAETQSKAF